MRKTINLTLSTLNFCVIWCYEIIGIISGYGKSASSRVYKLLLSTCINNTKPNGQIPQSKLDQRRRVQSY